MLTLRCNVIVAVRWEKGSIKFKWSLETGAMMPFLAKRATASSGYQGSVTGILLHQRWRPLNTSADLSVSLSMDTCN